MFTLEIVDSTGKYIKQWKWYNMPIPNIGDSLLLHFGDNNETEIKVSVIDRIFSGVRTDVVVLVTDFVDELLSLENGEEKKD